VDNVSANFISCMLEISITWWFVEHESSYF